MTACRIAPFDKTRNCFRAVVGLSLYLSCLLVGQDTSPRTNLHDIYIYIYIRGLSIDDSAGQQGNNSIVRLQVKHRVKQARESKERKCSMYVHCDVKSSDGA